MNKFKFLVVIFFPLCLTGLIFSSPLDLIYDAPGTFWGKVDTSVNNSDANHIQFNMEQGIRFVHLTWMTWYFSMNGWQSTGISKNNYWSYGVKNTTFIPHLTFGLEEENYVFSTPPVPINAVVGYAALNLDWNLKEHQ